MNGATFAAGLVDEAFSLDGVDDYIAIPGSNAWNFGSGDFTVDFWEQSSNSTTRMHALSFEPSYGARNLDLDFNDPDFFGQPIGLWVYWNSSGDNRIAIGSRGTYTDGQWHYIALTRSEATFTLHVDGSIVGLTQYSPGIDLSGSTINYIGAGQAGGTVPFFFWSGLVDEVEIFDRALSVSEIQAIYDAGSAGKCKDEDGDGFRPSEDCDETDVSINPDAIELPGNFIDENCDGNLGDCDPCRTWRNHGEYVRCVSQAVDALVSGGAITEEEGDALASSAASSNIGKRGFVPVECP